ncbi:type I glyceraldehyde-3-phosphate dehydrogenase [Pseudonocardia acaciae]|uniref:type I glyceraldehyde-3-phosphate dehydrogenase n=1 Tax=Pseudonocardia acaciae TaxID=551276 RepID=UPI00048F8D00|nr:type I glyceraldehyde-3-phosphate dehydrogenase [Pseudonocardia acaciae]
MRARVGINGLGRIGRDVLRGIVERDERAFQVVAVNDVAPMTTLAHLLRRDSTYGRWGHQVEVAGDYLAIDEESIHTSQEPDPARLNWSGLDVDIVVDATGRFRTGEQASAHLAAGASKVILTAPAIGVDTTVVMGVNHDQYDPSAHHVISNASCTTNCAAPMAQVLHESFGIVEALLTTVHSYTPDQNLLDGPHKDLRRARAAAINIIPTSTGAARAVGQVLPELDGRLDGVALRVPVVDASLVDLTARLAEPVTVGQVNRAFTTAADGPLKGILRCTTDPVVSHDVIGENASCLLDLGLTQVVGDLVKVFGWYDNEWGYAQRTIDLVELVTHTLPRADR